MSDSLNREADSSLGKGANHLISQAQGSLWNGPPGKIEKTANERNTLQLLAAIGLMLASCQRPSPSAKSVPHAVKGQAAALTQEVVADLRRDLILALGDRFAFERARIATDSRGSRFWVVTLQALKEVSSFCAVNSITSIPLR
jgi:hypothetical protein